MRVCLTGENWNLVANSLIQKSRAAIIDVSDGNQNVMYELGQILNEKGSKNSLIICEAGSVIPSPLMGYVILPYSFGNDRTLALFYQGINEWCSSVFNLPSESDERADQVTTIFEDAHRLIDKKEYSASIIIAFSSLEAFLRSAGKMNPTETIQDFFQYSLLPINSNEYQALGRNGEQFLKIRNRIAHNKYNAKEEEAVGCLAFAEDVTVLVLKGKI